MKLTIFSSWRGPSGAHKRSAGLRSAGVHGALLAALALGLVGCADEAPTTTPGAEAPEVVTAPLFVNGNMEQGTHNQPPTGWIIETYLNRGTQSSPSTVSQLQLNSGGTARTYTWRGTEGSQADSYLGSNASLRWPRFGEGVAALDVGTGRNTNAMRQTMTLSAQDIDPLDGKLHVRFAIAPVLQNPSHSATQQPYFFVELRNITRGTTLYQDYNYANQPGVPWKNDGAASTYLYTDWALVDIAPTSAEASIGDQVELNVISAACSLGGHWARVYIDGIGATVPSLFISGVGPASANAGDLITYDMTYNNGGTGAAGQSKFTMTMPAKTTFHGFSGATCSPPAVGSTGVITCDLGTINPGQSGTFQITVQANASATGLVTNGNYTIESATIPPLLGPKVFTNITQNVNYADLQITKTNGVGGVAWGSQVQYTIVASNAGPSNATGAIVNDILPAQLVNATWSCSGTGGGTCTASGSGNIADSNVNLPAGASVTYLLDADVIAGSSTGQLSNTASISVPSGITDSYPSNNADADVDQIGELRTVTLIKTGWGKASIVSVPSSIDCGVDCTQAVGNFVEGQQIVLSANPVPGDTFEGWSGPCSGTTNCSFTITGNAVVTADISAPTQPDGTPCEVNEQCTSGSCADGYCCDTACTSGCQACNLAGTEGVCSYLNFPFPDPTCDGVDDNCDGQADEDFVSGPTTCGLGACASAGTSTCSDEGVLGSTCVPGTPQQEVCDAIDNDCDGFTDTQDANLLRIPCANQSGVCAGAMRPATLCTNGTWDDCPVSVYAGHGFPHYSQLDLCDGRDNDCSGQTDEDFVGGATSCGLGECTSTGTQQCVLGVVQNTCVPAIPSAETCNGRDNDCNGLADINLNGQNVCPGLNTVALSCPPPLTSLTSTPVVYQDQITPSNGHFQCRLDGQPWFDCSGDPRCTGGAGPQNCAGVQTTLSNLQPGNHTLLVRAVDPAGNVDDTPAFCAWQIDTTVPDTLILVKPDSLTQSTTASFTFGSNVGNVSHYMCSLDDAAAIPCDAVTQLTGLSEGSHTLDVYVVTTDGTTDPNPASYTWVVDLTAPETTMDVRPAAVTCNTTANFEFSSTSEDAEGFRCRVSQLSPQSVEGTFGTCNQGHFAISGLTDGVYEFEVATYDIHGNQDPSPARATFRVATVMPDTFIEVAPANPSTNASATFSFSSDLADVTFRCALDPASGAPNGSDWAPCSQTTTFSGLADGEHELFVVAADRGCMVDDSPASYAWIVDTTLPSTGFVTTPPKLVGSGEGSEFTYEDPNNPGHEVFECRLDGGEWFACDGGAYDVGDLPVGEHTFTVRTCSEISSLCVLEPVSYAWTVTESPCPRDTEAPVLTCAETQTVECEGGVGAVDAELFAPSSEDACGVAWQDFVEPDAFGVGTSLVVFTAADYNDNLSSCVTPVTVVDTVAPTITCPAPRAVTTPDTGCFVTVDFGDEATSADACSGDVVTVVSNAPPTYTVGETEVTYTAVDPSGNSATCTTTVTVTDDVPPMIDCEAAVSRNAAAGECSWSGAISATARDNCALEVVALGETKSYPVGEHTIDFDSTDDDGNEATCQTVLTVVDVTDPTAICGTWDAERALVEVEATDACDADATAVDVACVLAGGEVVSDCPVTVAGARVTLDGGVGAPFTLRWTARAEDASGNVATTACEQALDPDTDGDGFDDSADNCPLVDNADQLDTNGNGIGDVCDDAPYVGLGTAGGGGCNAGPMETGLPLVLAFLGLIAILRRRSVAAR